MINLINGAPAINPDSQHIPKHVLFGIALRANGLPFLWNKQPAQAEPAVRFRPAANDATEHEGPDAA